MFMKLGRRLLPLMMLSVFISPVHAGMISTNDLLQQGNRERLITALERDDVQQQLVEMGVDPGAAMARVHDMTDTEIAQLHTQIETLPAGGRASVDLSLIVLLIIVLVAL